MTETHRPIALSPDAPVLQTKHRSIRVAANGVVQLRRFSDGALELTTLVGSDPVPGPVRMSPDDFDVLMVEVNNF